MTDGKEDARPPQPDQDELASKQFDRDLQRAIAFREEVFSRDPDSSVTLADAAAVLGLRASELEQTIEQGRLRVHEIDNIDIIRVADLKAAFDDETRRRNEFAKGWTELRSRLDWDE